MSLMRAPTAMLAVLLLAGCAGHEPAMGQVTGRLLSQGGGSPGQRPMAGTVAFTATGHEPTTVQVPKSGVFSVQLPPGLRIAKAQAPVAVIVSRALTSS